MLPSSFSLLKERPLSWTGLCLLLSGAAIWCPVLFCSQILYASSHQPSNAQLRQKLVPQVAPPHLWEIRMLYAWSSLLFSSPGKTWEPGAPSWSLGAVPRVATTWEVPQISYQLHWSRFCSYLGCRNLSSAFLDFSKRELIHILLNLCFCARKKGQGFPILLSCCCAAKSLQSCPTLCNPIDSSPPGSSVPGILQARTLEWVAISFSNAKFIQIILLNMSTLATNRRCDF